MSIFDIRVHGGQEQLTGAQAAILGVPAVAFAAFCVWLAVRIVNRRERWARWTAAGLAVLLAYPLSMGPACWLSSRSNSGWKFVSSTYQPLIKIASQNRMSLFVVERYACLGSSSGWRWFIVTNMPPQEADWHWGTLMPMWWPDEISISAD